MNAAFTATKNYSGRFYVILKQEKQLIMLNISIVSALVFLLQTAIAPPTALSLSAVVTTEQASTANEARNNPINNAINHQLLDSLLQKHVSDLGKVNYKTLKANKAALDAYCQLLSDNPVQEIWTRDEKMAFWINAYNAFTLKLIVDNYPTKSILNFDGGKTWDVRRIKIGDKKYSLNNIENDILRPQFKDPRIHFAVNCAAKSCPPIWNHAYTAENLETSLEARARAFVNDKRYNTLSSTRAQVSKIFDWYGADFGDLKKFLNQYAETKLKSSATVTFNDYNWDLNGND